MSPFEELVKTVTAFLAATWAWIVEALEGRLSGATLFEIASISGQVLLKHVVSADPKPHEVMKLFIGAEGASLCLGYSLVRLAVSENDKPPRPSAMVGLRAAVLDALVETQLRFMTASLQASARATGSRVSQTAIAETARSPEVAQSSRVAQEVWLRKFEAALETCPRGGDADSLTPLFQVFQALPFVNAMSRDVGPRFRAPSGALLNEIRAFVRGTRTLDDVHARMFSIAPPSVLPPGGSPQRRSEVSAPAWAVEVELDLDPAPAADAGLRLFDAPPRPMLLEQVMEQPVTALLVTAIVNPMGPTLTAFILKGELEKGACLPLVRLTLNPFRQEVVVLGELNCAEAWRPDVAIRSVFKLGYAECPTLAFTSDELNAEESLPVLADFLGEFADATDTWDLVRKFPGNPWDRISQEMDAGAERLANGRRSGASTPRQVLSPPNALEFARAMASDAHALPEIDALFYAWTGAIGHAPHSSNGGTVMTTQEFTQVFAHLVTSCRIPDLSATE